MIYTIIISLLIEKPFYLLRPQSFSFEIVSEFIDTFLKFLNFMSQGGGAFDSLFYPVGRVLYTMIVPGGLLPSSRFPVVVCLFWMKLIPALLLVLHFYI